MPDWFGMQLNLLRMLPNPSDFAEHIKWANARGIQSTFWIETAEPVEFEGLLLPILAS